MIKCRLHLAISKPGKQRSTLQESSFLPEQICLLPWTSWNTLIGCHRATTREIKADMTELRRGFEGLRNVDDGKADQDVIQYLA